METKYESFSLLYLVSSSKRTEIKKLETHKPMTGI